MTRAADRTGAGSREPAGRGVAIRKAGEDDLQTCWEIWRDGLNAYMGRLNLPPIPAEVGSVGRLHAHLRSTDPDRFVVAVRLSDDGAERLLGFASAARRQAVWFLSMLFVRPEEQGTGIGRALLEHVLPTDGAVLATATDSAQPISNALYAGYGIVPRLPLFSVVGRPDRDDSFDPLPRGITATPLDELDEVDAIDAEVLGFSHPEDHAFARLEGRRGFLYRDGGGAAVGYGYGSEVGRVGPVAVRDPALMSTVLGHVLTEIVPRGASAVWVPGASDAAMVALLRAGFRFEGFPVLLCWDRPFADFSRYLPISPGLL